MLNTIHNFPLRFVCCFTIRLSPISNESDTVFLYISYFSTKRISDTYGDVLHGFNES